MEDRVHIEYREMRDKWRRCRDCISGEDAVKGRGLEYLPRVGRTEGEYEEYKKRASFYNAGGRTLMALLGALFRKPVEIELSEDLEYMREECDDLRTPFTFFVRRVAREILTVGRYGVLVDLSREGELGTRPYFVGYPTERIVYWESENQQFRRIHIDISGGSLGKEEKEEEKRMVLELDGEGKYRQRKYRKGKRWEEKGKWELEEEVYPKREGRRLDFLPFVGFSAVDLDLSVKAPPLLDLVNVNLSHYRTHADLAHCLHFVAMPTPYIIAGSKRLKLGEEPILLGSSQAWYLEEGSSVGMLEFSGAGVTALESKLKRDELHMAHLGARLLEDPKRDAESAESLKIRYLGEHSILSMISQTVSIGMERLLDYAGKWRNPRVSGEKNRVQVNREFFEETISPHLLRELIQARQQGVLDEDQLKWNLQKSGILP